jgi:hypothetical protein
MTGLTNLTWRRMMFRQLAGRRGSVRFGRLFGRIALFAVRRAELVCLQELD